LLLATRQFADATVAAPAGRIDHLSAPAFEAALTPLLDQAGARHGALVLDFSGVDYISSVGLRVLMIAAKQMRQAQATLALAALQDVVGEIIKISRFDRVLAVSATLDDALRHCSAEAQASYQSRPPGP
jgi:anti-sigma B factor antagonist/stage II sporulation protein AA (anti-sigma F factor antagonist)